jgi:hypothetical protein
LDSSGPQEFGKFLIGLVAVIPAGGYNPGFLRAVQMIPKSALQTPGESSTICRFCYTLASRLLTMYFIEDSHAGLAAVRKVEHRPAAGKRLTTSRDTTSQRLFVDSY